MFKEEDHPRDGDGKFTDNGGESKSYSDGVNERIKWAREHNVELPLSADGSVDDLRLQEIREAKKPLVLSKREYAVLRQEVIRKNSVQKDKVKPANFAFTADNFYVYKTSGDDDFTPIIKLNIEEEYEKINLWLDRYGGKK